MAVTRVVLIALGVLTSAIASTAEAQNLADVARRTGRKTERPSPRVFTNADLPPPNEAPAPQAVPVADLAAPVPGDTAPAVDAASPEAAGVEGSPAEPIKPREKRPEEYWRARGRDLRERLARVTDDVSNTSSRLDALESGPASPAAEQERKVVAAALAKRLADLGYLQDEQNRLEARARAENIPVAWVR